MDIGLQAEGLKSQRDARPPAGHSSFSRPFEGSMMLARNGDVEEGTGKQAKHQQFVAKFVAKMQNSQALWHSP